MDSKLISGSRNSWHSISKKYFPFKFHIGTLMQIKHKFSSWEQHCSWRPWQTTARKKRFLKVKTMKSEKQTSKKKALAGLTLFLVEESVVVTHLRLWVTTSRVSQEEAVGCVWAGQTFWLVRPQWLLKCDRGGSWSGSRWNEWFGEQPQQRKTRVVGYVETRSFQD